MGVSAVHQIRLTFPLRMIESHPIEEEEEEEEVDMMQNCVSRWWLYLETILVEDQPEQIPVGTLLCKCVIGCGYEEQPSDCAALLLQFACRERALTNPGVHLHLLVEPPAQKVGHPASTVPVYYPIVTKEVTKQIG